MHSPRGKAFFGFRKRKVSTCCDVFSSEGQRVLKYPRNDIPKPNNMEKVPLPAEVILHNKAPPVKEPPCNKPPCPPTVLFSPKDSTSPVHNKENIKGDRTPDDTFNDSGYSSLHSSHIDLPHSGSPLNSPLKCLKAETGAHPPVTLPTASTPVNRFSTRTASSRSHSLPIVDFTHAVCEELARSYQKNNRYDWSVVAKVAENYPLDRVIGRHMGLEHVDVFSCLQLRNMPCILARILAMLGDADLISCKFVCKTWGKIVLDDRSSVDRCLKAQKAFQESRNSRKRAGLTRDVSSPRVVLSCTQTLAKAAPSSASNCSITRQTSRFEEYMQVVAELKQDESLCACRLCGSPAKRSAGVPRATCTRDSCGYQFCTSCKEPYHGSAPCRTLKSHISRKDILIPGSSRSQRNIRRL